MNSLVSALTCIALLIPSLAASQAPEIATTMAFTEGPVVDRDGNVYFTELVFQRIMKLTPQGVLTVFREHSNNANGMLIDPEGRLIACEGAESQRMGVLQKFKPQVTRTDLKTGKDRGACGQLSGQAVRRAERRDDRLEGTAATSPISPAAPCTGWTRRARSSVFSRHRRFNGRMAFRSRPTTARSISLRRMARRTARA